MANKKFGYDIKVNYGNIHDDTQKVIRGLQELDKAIGRLNHFMASCAILNRKRL